MKGKCPMVVGSFWRNPNPDLKGQSYRVDSVRIIGVVDYGSKRYIVFIKIWPEGEWRGGGRHSLPFVVSRNTFNFRYGEWQVATL